MTQCSPGILFVTIEIASRIVFTPVNYLDAQLATKPTKTFFEKWSIVSSKCTTIQI